ncbi:hypothetical protein O0235_06925 [Tepidiforma flava]|uniref:Uncharacterized protein n=1 Tax=Tepidiforma flava TaxID=3004094 RepID=A0ABY7M9T0_9CHLR|nr:hypothetical protein [Tepidiforma flava]WBL37298.1 hypothetical protein O0235_06925 [Tepidiforma flava]
MAAVVALLILGVPGIVLLAAWMFGGLDTRGPYVDWTLVNALASVGGAVATAVAAGTVVLVSQELRLQEEAERVARQPYLRVDVDLDEDWTGKSFDRPRPTRTFNAWDFGRDDLARALEGVGQADGPRGLLVFVRNLQNAAVGIAYDVTVDLRIEWGVEDAPGSPGVREECDVSLSFAYVAPGQVTAFEVCRLRHELSWLRVTVVDVRYQGLFGRPEQLREVHGVLEMVWSPQEVRHERRFRLSR